MAPPDSSIAPGAPGLVSHGARCLAVGLLVAVSAAATLGAFGRPAPWLRALLFAPALVASLVAAARRLRFDRGLTVILSLGALLDLAYWTYTDIGERNYDTPAQLHYIGALRAGGLPSSTECMVCYHPPLYYGLAAAWASAGDLLGAKASVSLPMFSLILAQCFSLLAALMIRQFAERAFVAHLASAMVVAWPMTVLDSVRVHNDVLAAPLLLASLYFAACWREREASRDLYVAAAAAGLAVLTKSSGYVMVATLLALLVVRLARAPRPRARPVAMALALFAVSPLASVVFGALRPIEGSAGLCHQLLGKLCDLRRQSFGSCRVPSFVYFDVRSFLARPFLVVQEPETGRDYFWNRLLKSSLFGTHNGLPDRELSAWPYPDIALALNALLLALVVVGLAGLATSTVAYVRRRGVLLLASAGFFSMLAAFAFVSPFPDHSDFRLVTPLLAPAALLYAEAVDRWRQAGRALWLAAYAVAAAFVLGSVLFFLPLRGVFASVPPAELALGLGDFTTPRDSGTSPDARGVWRFGGHEVVRLAVPGGPAASAIDLSLSHEDSYEIEVIGGGGSFRAEVGPERSVSSGLARYRVPVEPAVRDVREVRVRATRGDGEYALGHLLIE